MSEITRRHRSIAIIAGGRGLRLWPRSTPTHPKQLRSFFGMPTLLEQTLVRSMVLADDKSSVYVVTVKDLIAETARIVQTNAQIVAEPFGRDTALCIGLSALLADQANPGTVLTILPADHWVDDHAAFQRTLARAAQLAETDDRLITIGVPPSRPETGYGYLMVD